MALWINPSTYCFDTSQANPEPQILGAARVALAESKHKRTWSRSCSRGSRLAPQGRFGKARSRDDQPDDREVFHRTAATAALQQLHELLPMETRNN